MSQVTSEIESVPAGVFEAHPARDAEQSGRFVIEGRASSTMLPPAGEQSGVGALAETRELAESLVELLDAPQRPKTLPPPVPAVALSQRPAAGSADTVISILEPYYRGLPVSDRVELRIDDLSLDLDNPYARSSLVPPVPKPFATARWALIASGLTAAVALGGALQASPSSQASVSLQTPHARAVVAAKLSPATVAAAPVVVQPSMQASSAAAPLVVAPVAVPMVVPAAGRPAIASKLPRMEALPVAEVKATAPLEAVAPASAPAELSAAAAADAPLPESPAREDIVAGFEAVRAELDACVAGGHGKTSASVTISGAGRVTYAMIDGDFAGTPAGSCIARTLRKAAFPHFTSPSLKVTFPFVF